jgi:hypothetical protein
VDIQAVRFPAQSLIADRFLYNRETHSWTANRFLDDLKQRHGGGVDCVMPWQSHTNLGVDNRNQMDELRGMPGGIPGLTDIVSQFHAAGVSQCSFLGTIGAKQHVGHIEHDSDFVELLATVDANKWLQHRLRWPTFGHLSGWL